MRKPVDFLYHPVLVKKHSCWLTVSQVQTLPASILCFFYFSLVLDDGGRRGGGGITDGKALKGHRWWHTVVENTLEKLYTGLLSLEEGLQKRRMMSVFSTYLKQTSSLVDCAPRDRGVRGSNPVSVIFMFHGLLYQREPWSTLSVGANLN